ncbi:hypothetical protein LWI28_026709 [Acer negundo]|uniref:Uncharacterized protein n=1 Tax=Acer negundo TaxID=4023 RepID=A0AAD5P4B3_ACENE|nr:hypothetical protein LWI28_026709 [Acer negundo]
MKRVTYSVRTNAKETLLRTITKSTKSIRSLACLTSTNRRPPRQLKSLRQGCTNQNPYITVNVNVNDVFIHQQIRKRFAVPIPIELGDFRVPKNVEDWFVLAINAGEVQATVAAVVLVRLLGLLVLPEWVSDDGAAVVAVERWADVGGWLSY